MGSDGVWDGSIMGADWVRIQRAEDDFCHLRAFKGAVLSGFFAEMCAF